MVEGDDVDLLAMGRPEGPGCYCAANHMLRQAIDRLGDSYRSVVIDNEAGMEHISRQTTRDVDWLFIISDPSQRGLAAAEQIVRLVDSLGTRIGQAGLIVNRVDGELPPEFLASASTRSGVPLLGRAASGSGHRPRTTPKAGRSIDLDDSSAIYPAVKAILQKCLPYTSIAPSAKEEAMLIIGENIHIISPAGQGGDSQPRHRRRCSAWQRRRSSSGAADPRPQHRPPEEGRARGDAVAGAGRPGGGRRAPLPRHHQPRGHQDRVWLC